MRRPCISRKSIAGLEQLIAKADATNPNEVSAAIYLRKLIDYHQSDKALATRARVYAAKAKAKERRKT
jgi:hypothetical protein